MPYIDHDTNLEYPDALSLLRAYVDRLFAATPDCEFVQDFEDAGNGAWVALCRIGKTLIAISAVPDRDVFAVSMDFDPYPSIAEAKKLPLLYALMRRNMFLNDASFAIVEDGTIVCRSARRMTGLDYEEFALTLRVITGTAVSHWNEVLQQTGA